MCTQEQLTPGIAARIDQAYLKVDGQSSVEGLRQVCKEAVQHKFRSLCIPPVLVPTVRRHFSELQVSVVIGYPLGLETTASKIFSIQEALEYEVAEFDVVLDLFSIKIKAERKLHDDIQRLISATGGLAKSIKAIVEAPILTNDELAWVCDICAYYELGFVKTSTGYNRPASTVEQVKIMHQTVGSNCKVKASGGIKSYLQALEFINAGADVIGTSSGVQIVQEELGYH